MFTNKKAPYKKNKNVYVMVWAYRYIRIHVIW